MTLVSVAMDTFSYGEHGMTQFPPNVEQIFVRRESAATWLVVRRNEVELRFPMSREDCEHLARLLVGDTTSEADVGGG